MKPNIKYHTPKSSRSSLFFFAIRKSKIWFLLDENSRNIQLDNEQHLIYFVYMYSEKSNNTHLFLYIPAYTHNK